MQAEPLPSPGTAIMARRKPSSIELVLFALVAFAASALVIYWWLTFDGIPPRERLASASGTVSEVRSVRRHLRFRLAGQPGGFEYEKNRGEVTSLQDALQTAGTQVVSVLYDPQYGPEVLQRYEVYQDVYEVAIDGRMVRSHADVAAAWRTHYAMGAGFGVLLALAGAAALLAATGKPPLRRRRH